MCDHPSTDVLLPMCVSILQRCRLCMYVRPSEMLCACVSILQRCHVCVCGCPSEMFLTCTFAVSSADMSLLLPRSVRLGGTLGLQLDLSWLVGSPLSLGGRSRASPSVLSAQESHFLGSWAEFTPGSSDSRWIWAVRVRHWEDPHGWLLGLLNCLGVCVCACLCSQEPWELAVQLSPLLSDSPGPSGWPRGLISFHCLLGGLAV
jgi:hypothetical protein